MTQDGRIPRFILGFKVYSWIPANKPGEMIGARKVTQFNPRTGMSKSWNETLDSAGRVRQVWPLKGNIKTKHYRFDKNGRYVGKW